MIIVHAFKHFVVRSLCSLLQTILIKHVLTIGYTMYNVARWMDDATNPSLQ